MNSDIRLHMVIVVNWQIACIVSGSQLKIDWPLRCVRFITASIEEFTFPMSKLSLIQPRSVEALIYNDVWNAISVKTRNLCNIRLIRQASLRVSRHC